MRNLRESLEVKRNYYDQIIQKVNKSLEKAPEKGHLRVTNCRGTTQCYLRSEASDKCGKYIPQKQWKLAKTLAQRDYDKKVLAYATKCKCMLDKVLGMATDDGIADIYRKSGRRKELIKPYELPDEDYVKLWESVEYEGKSFAENQVGFITEKGEKVRSKSEKIIADKLYKMEIPYRYEYPVNIKGIKVYPDFTVLNVRKRREYILEHLGMMDSSQYSEKAIRKINFYAENDIIQGENLLLTYESSKVPMKLEVIEKVIVKYLL